MTLGAANAVVKIQPQIWRPMHATEIFPNVLKNSSLRRYIVSVAFLSAVGYKIRDELRYSFVAFAQWCLKMKAFATRERLPQNLLKRQGTSISTSAVARKNFIYLLNPLTFPSTFSSSSSSSFSSSSNISPLIHPSLHIQLHHWQLLVHTLGIHLTFLLTSSQVCYLTSSLPEILCEFTTCLTSFPLPAHKSLTVYSYLLHRSLPFPTHSCELHNFPILTLARLMSIHADSKTSAIRNLKEHL